MGYFDYHARPMVAREMASRPQCENPQGCNQFATYHLAYKFESDTGWVDSQQRRVCARHAERITIKTKDLHK